MNSRLLVFLGIILLPCGACLQDFQAEQIINACIKKHGGDQFKNAHFGFDFRNHYYEFHYESGTFRYEKHIDERKEKDVLTNKGFKHYKEGREVELSLKEKLARKESLNSVHYFAFLPFFLNDPAVEKELLGETAINGKEYYKVQVTFKQKGGGSHHRDVYLYWINKNTFTMDYLAYRFHVNGGGIRFRSAYNQRKVGNVLFQDYINYKYEGKKAFMEIDEVYEAGELERLSIIELKNVRKL